MDNLEINKILNTDLRQTDQWANFIQTKGFKPIKLKNESIIHKFNLGNISIIKSFRPNLNEESLNEIQEIANQNHNILCKFSPNYNFDETLKEKYNYQNIDGTMTPTKTCIVDLTRSYDDIYKDYSENTRYKINRSIREKDRIEIINNPASKNIDMFYDSLKIRQTQKKFITFSRGEMKLLSNLFNKNSYLVSAYDKNNDLVVSNLYFVNGEKVTYFAGSLNTPNHKSKAGYQLIHEAIQFFKSVGVKIYDFEGIMDERNKYTSDWEGLTNFKLKFGKTIVSYPVTMIKYNSPIFRKMVRLFGI